MGTSGKLKWQVEGNDDGGNRQIGKPANRRTGLTCMGTWLLLGFVGICHFSIIPPPTFAYLSHDVFPPNLPLSDICPSTLPIRPSYPPPRHRLHLRLCLTTAPLTPHPPPPTPHPPRTRLAAKAFPIMADMELALAWLGLPQYLDRLLQAGFDSWDTLMEITEPDLEVLNVELGHRRKLQREIANSRRFIESPTLPTLPTLPTHNHGPLLFPLQARQDGAAGSGAQPAQSPSDSLAVVLKKRAYVHHPKSDSNAPARPHSGYVLFSKAVREDLKSQRLSFTDISKEVGERWQRLSPAERHGWKRRSAVPREQYKNDLVKYQQSDHHRNYQQYLSEFTSAQAARRAGGDPSPYRNG